jgi:tetratricopeptide (TPR) repeat protein
VLKDTSGLESDRREFHAHPVEGMPPLRMRGGMVVELELIVVDSAVQRQMARDLALQESSGDLRRATELVKEQKFEEGLAAIDAVLAKKPDLAAAIYLKGQTLWRMERLEEAEECLRRMMELEHEQPGVPGTLAMVLLRRGIDLQESGNEAEGRPILEESIELFDLQLVETPGDRNVLTDRAVALDKLGRHEELADALRAVITANPDNLHARLRLADILTKSGKPDEAMQLLDEIATADDMTASALYNVAVGMYNEGNLEAALMAIDKTITISPEMARAHRLRGRTLMSQGESEAAVASLERAIELAPEDPEAAVDKQLLEALKKRQ